MQPLSDMTSDKILIESFIDGEPVLQYLGSNHTNSERQKLATIGLRTVMEMVFLHDFVHGDLHPGNIIVDRNKSGNLRLNMIDCVSVVQHFYHQYFLEIGNLCLFYCARFLTHQYLL